MGRRRVGVVNDAYAMAFMDTLRGVLGYARPRDRWEIVRHVHTQWTVDDVRGAELDGLLVRSTTAQAIRELASLKIPTVNILGGELVPGWGHVELDDVAVGRQAAEHLLSKGLQRFGYWGEDMQFDRDRLGGFGKALERRRRPCLTIRDLLPEARSIGWADIQDAALLRRFLQRLAPPAGVMALNDGAALLVIQTAREMGLRVPEDIAVVGVDNFLLDCELAPVPLTSVDPNAEMMGVVAAELLDRMMEGEPAPPTAVLVPPRGVVQRRSTDALAVEDADVRIALAYIREHACEGITVADVMAKVPICRRVLEQRFQDAIGHSPGREIRRVKLHRAAELLRDTTLKLGIIAGRCGYQTIQHLSAVFVKEFGVSTRAYRQQ